MAFRNFPMGLLAIVIALCCALVLPACRRSPNDPKPSQSPVKPNRNEKQVIKVAQVLRLDDRENDSVHNLSAGIEIARQLFEQDNRNISIDLAPYAHAEAIDTVEEAARRIVSAGYPAAIGAEWSSEAIVLGNVFNRRRVVYLAPTASNPDVTNNRAFVFRGCFSDDVVSKLLAQFVRDRLKPHSIGVIVNESSPYAEFLSREFQRHSAPIPTAVGVVSKPGHLHDVEDGGDMRRIVENFAKQSITHVAVLSYLGDFVRFAVEAERIDYHPIYVGSDGWGSNYAIREPLERRGVKWDKLEAYRNSYWSGNIDSEIGRRFQALYREMFSRDPVMMSAIGFDSAWALFHAMARASNPKDGSSIRTALLELQGLELLTHKDFCFADKNGPPTVLQIYRLRHGQWDYVDAVR